MILRLKYSLEGRSPQWYSVRKKFLKYHPRCIACSTTSKLEVHHIKPYERYPELELDLDNMMTLCRYCHLVFGHFKDFSTYNPNVVSDTIFYNASKFRNSVKI
jgi:hypothetical protein